MVTALGRIPGCVGEPLATKRTGMIPGLRARACRRIPSGRIAGRPAAPCPGPIPSSTCRIRTGRTTIPRSAWTRRDRGPGAVTRAAKMPRGVIRPGARRPPRPGRRDPARRDPGWAGQAGATEAAAAGNGAIPRPIPAGRARTGAIPARSGLARPGPARPPARSQLARPGPARPGPARPGLAETATGASRRDRDRDRRGRASAGPEPARSGRTRASASATGTASASGSRIRAGPAGTRAVQPRQPGPGQPGWPERPGPIRGRSRPARSVKLHARPPCAKAERVSWTRARPGRAAGAARQRNGRPGGGVRCRADAAR